MQLNSLANILSQTSHRPWPLPKSKPFMIQYWEELLFLHWEISKQFLDEILPQGLEADTFQGKAYIGLVPFRMKGVRPIFLPPLPWVSYFSELNVRTYVKTQGKPGVYFFSLDAGNRIIVEVARKYFHLPYLNADIHFKREGIKKEFHCFRIDSRANPGEFHVTYFPSSKIYQSKQNTLENWLTERYCLYSIDFKGRLYRGEVHHLPWPLQKAECYIYNNTILKNHNIHILQSEPLIHYSESLKVAFFPLIPLF